MARKKKATKRTKEKRKMKFPAHKFKPEDLLNFVQWDSFVGDWKRLGYDDDGMRALEIAIMAGPKRLQLCLEQVALESYALPKMMAIEENRRVYVFAMYILRTTQ